MACWRTNNHFKRDYLSKKRSNGQKFFFDDKYMYQRKLFEYDLFCINIKTIIIYLTVYKSDVRNLRIQILITNLCDVSKCNRTDIFIHCNI